MAMSPFDYLVSCWKRASSAQLGMKPSTIDEHKAHVFSEAKRIALCYIEYCITMPEMFEWVTCSQQVASPCTDLIHRDTDASVAIYQKLKVDGDEDGGIPNEILQALISKFDEEPALAEAFQRTLEELSAETSTLTLLSIYMPNLNVRSIFKFIRIIAHNRCKGTTSTLELQGYCSVVCKVGTVPSGYSGCGEFSQRDTIRSLFCPSCAGGQLIPCPVCSIHH